MHPDELVHPTLFYGGEAFFLERCQTRTASYFGGPFEGSVTGVKHGPRQIHHVATINGDCFEPLWHVVGGGTLRLMYGICYEGCRLKYRNSAVATEVLEIEPTVSKNDWPYPEYAAHL